MRNYRSTIGISGIICAALIGAGGTAALSAENLNYSAELHALPNGRALC